MNVSVLFALYFNKNPSKLSYITKMNIILDINQKKRERLINMDLENKYTPPIKLKKTTDKVRKTKQIFMFIIILFQDHQNDVYCFECHHGDDVINCDSCPRVYHPKCLGLISLSERDWTCPECEVCF